MNLECCWLFQQHAVIHNEMNYLKHLQSSFELIQKLFKSLQNIKQHNVLCFFFQYK